MPHGVSGDSDFSDDSRGEQVALFGRETAVYSSFHFCPFVLGAELQCLVPLQLILTAGNLFLKPLRRKGLKPVTDFHFFHALLDSCL